MEISLLRFAVSIVSIVVLITWAWRVVNWVWLRPKKLERCLREQGLNGNSYRLLFGDLEEISKMTNIRDFRKPNVSPLVKLLATGLPNYDGEKWTTHRKIINPAFQFEKLKNMSAAFYQCCNDMMCKWVSLVSEEGSIELDVWPYLQTSYDEGRRIFELENEQTELAMKNLESLYIPGWRFLPTKINKRIEEIDKELQVSLKGINTKREMAIKAGEAKTDDLLGILLESNFKEIQERGSDENTGMNLQDVIEEFLLVWTMVILSRYPSWQARAREEALHVFGKSPQSFTMRMIVILSKCLIVILIRFLCIFHVTMILYEALRLYSPVIVLTQTVREETKLGNLILPIGVQVFLPTLLVHHDFSKATRGQVSFFPFGWGPRICIGQHFSMVEVKMSLSMILQRFSSELSSSYTHAPLQIMTLQPQYGAHIILDKL
ncbi:hypothetical protein ACB098_11G049600 [Castanea mollissima]